MSDWDRIGFAQQGWQCPICGAVYSPMTMACMNCTGWKISNTISTETKEIMSVEEYLKDLKDRNNAWKEMQP